MPSGVCPTNLDGDMVQEGVEIHWHGVWDGTSLRTDPGGCTGSIVSIWGRNTAGQTRYAHFQGRKGTWRTITLSPGFDNSANPLTNPQLRNAGFRDITDIDGAVISISSTPPA